MLHPKTKDYQFEGCNNFDDVCSLISKLQTRKEKGDAFEVFTEGYFRSLEYVKEIYPTSCVPEDLIEKLKLTQTDHGIDFLLVTKKDEYIAIQSKFRKYNNVNYAHVATFLAHADHPLFKSRILITNKDVNTEILKDRQKFNFINYDELKDSDIQNIINIIEHKPVQKITYQPRAYQRYILDDLRGHFKEFDLGTLLMACGTGKTFTSTKFVSEYDKENNISNILILVPTIYLCQQFHKEFLRHQELNGEISSIILCSDNEVADTEGNHSVLVTTDKQEVINHFKDNPAKYKLVVSTYQSSRRIPNDIEFDVGLFDEAHKTTGSADSYYSHALKDTNIKIKKRLFLTATPRVCNFKDEEIETFSMDDESVYGKIVHDYSIGKAIKDRSVCDYSILISSFANEELNLEKLKRAYKIEFADDFRNVFTLSNIFSLIKAIEKVSAKKIILYFNTIASSEEFAKLLKDIPFFYEYKIFTVDGKMNMRKKRNIINNLRVEEDKVIICNCSVLNEGVDVPSVDMIGFMESRESTTDIIQAMGRPIRLAPGKEFGYVLIPLYKNYDESDTEENKKNKKEYFSTLMSVLKALEDNDETLREIINKCESDLKENTTSRRATDKLGNKVQFIGENINVDDLWNGIEVEYLRVGRGISDTIRKILEYVKNNILDMRLYSFKENMQLYGMVKHNQKKLEDMGIEVIWLNKSENMLKDIIKNYVKDNMLDMRLYPKKEYQKLHDNVRNNKKKLEKLGIKIIWYKDKNRIIKMIMDKYVVNNILDIKKYAFNSNKNYQRIIRFQKELEDMNIKIIWPNKNTADEIIEKYVVDGILDIKTIYKFKDNIKIRASIRRNIKRLEEKGIKIIWTNINELNIQKNISKYVKDNILDMRLYTKNKKLYEFLRFNRKKLEEMGIKIIFPKKDKLDEIIEKYVVDGILDMRLHSRNKTLQLFVNRNQDKFERKNIKIIKFDISKNTLKDIIIKYVKNNIIDLNLYPRYGNNKTENTRLQKYVIMNQKRFEDLGIEIIWSKRSKHRRNKNDK